MGENSEKAYNMDKLHINGDQIHYKIRQQDNTFVSMQCRDTTSNRLFVQWVQIHD
jgi:hypothetical protein